MPNNREKTNNIASPRQSNEKLLFVKNFSKFNSVIFLSVNAYPIAEIAKIKAGTTQNHDEYIGQKMNLIHG